MQTVRSLGIVGNLGGQGTDRKLLDNTKTRNNENSFIIRPRIFYRAKIKKLRILITSQQKEILEK